MELRKQLKEIGPPANAGDVVGEGPAKRKPVGKLVMGGILLIVVGAAGVGMMSKGGMQPDPGALGMPAGALGGEGSPVASAAATQAQPGGVLEASRENAVIVGQALVPTTGEQKPQEVAQTSPTRHAIPLEKPAMEAKPVLAQPVAQTQTVATPAKPDTPASNPAQRKVVESKAPAQAKVVARPAARSAADRIGISEE